MKADFSVIENTNLELGESPVWDEKKQCLYVINYRGFDFKVIDWKTKAVKSFVLPQKLSCIALTDGDELIAGAADGKLYFVNPNNGTLRLFTDAFEFKGERMNDGKVGPDGCYYVGSKSLNYDGAFWRVQGDGTVTELFDGVGNSNGLAFSSSGDRGWYIDSLKYTIDAFDFRNGNFLNRRSILPLPERYKKCVFDGMTIDEDDNLWVAVWNGSNVLKINTKEEKIEEIFEFPLPRVTCTCFAGENLDELALSTAAYATDLEAHPLAGQTLVFKPGVKGTLSYRFVTGK